jgi:hypothetical protein
LKGQELSNAWRQRLLDAAKSGSTVKVWCSRNGYTLDQYYYWNRRLREQDAQPASVNTDTKSPRPSMRRGRPCVDRAADRKQDTVAPDQWLRVEPASEPTSVGLDHLTVRISGAEIDVHSGFNANLLRSVVQALSVQQC